MGSEKFGPEGQFSDFARSAIGPDAGITMPTPGLFAQSEVLADRFRIIRFIAHGGMGSVYEAEDLHLGGRVALKVVRPEIAADEQMVTRFKREIKLAMNVTHPNVCRVHDLGTHGSITLFLTMELLNGETLAARLRRGRLTTEEALPIVQQMAAGLDAAHRAGIVHRDFKPSNVMLTTAAGGGTQAVVTDFGLAHRFIAREPLDETRQLTPPGLFVGTPDYIAPEQLEAGPITPAVDIFALGVVMYEMVTGKLPFSGDTPVAAAVKRLQETPVSPRQLVAGLDARWESAILRCLQRAPADRFASAAEAAAALTAAEPPATPKPSPTLRRRAMLWTAALLALLGSGEWLWLSSRRTTIDSLAILPFANATHDASLEYIREGIVEGVINSVAQLPQLMVIAKSSTLGYKPDADPQAAGKRLNVRAVLTGQVSRRGSDVLVGVELVDVRNNRHVWGKTYRRTMATLANVETEIAGEISDELRLKLSSTNQRRLAQHSTDNPEAYQAYIKGLYHWNKRTDEDIQKGIEYFQQAIELDPNYALAYAGLADCYMFHGSSPTDRFTRALAAARKALDLDPNLAMAHATIGYIDFIYEWNWAEAERELKQALELNPNYATAHSMYARYLTAMGRFEEAAPQGIRALELDPLSPGISTGLGMNSYLARRFDQAIGQYHKTLEMNPKFPVAKINLASAYNQMGRYADAVAVVQPVADSGDEYALIHLGCAHARAGRNEDARRILKRIVAVSRDKYISPYFISYLYTALGEKENAFAMLSRACDERDPLVPSLKVQPELDPLRSDPRFAALLRRVGLTGN